MRKATLAHVTPFNPLYFLKTSFPDIVSNVILNQSQINFPTAYDMTQYEGKKLGGAPMTSHVRMTLLPFPNPKSTNRKIFMSIRSFVCSH